MKARGETLRCVIVDDNRGFLEAAANLLGRQGLTIVGVAVTSAEALDLVSQQKPDVTIVDVHLGEESGFDLAEQLVRAAVPSPVILTSTRSAQEFGELVATSPALGFVPKVELSREAIRHLLDDSASAPD